MDFIQFVLSLLALICSVSILLLEFKEISPQTKRKTRVTAALSLLALVATFTVESLDRQSETRTEIKRNQSEIEQTRQTIAEIQRTLEKMERIRASAEIVVDPRQVGLGLPAYQRRLEESAARCLREPANPDWIKDARGNLQPTVFRVTPTPECLPGTGEPLVQAMLSSFHLTLELSMPSEGRLDCGGSSESDLTAELLASLTEGTLELQYNWQKQTFILEASGLELDLLDTRRSGRIAASGDLKKSLMKVRIWSSNLRPAEASALARGTQIQHLTVRFDSASPKIIDLDSARLLKDKPPETGSTSPSYCVAPVDPG
jgi:hypothetical protein